MVRCLTIASIKIAQIPNFRYKTELQVLAPDKGRHRGYFIYCYLP